MQKNDHSILWGYIWKFVAMVAMAFLLINEPPTIKPAASPEYGRYQLQFYHYLLWTRTDNLAIQPIAAMCHNQETGWCDEALINGTRERVLLQIIDFHRQRTAVVLSKQYAGETVCWWWWWQPYRDTTGNPHPFLAEWIDCTSIPVYTTQ